jgi:hypothetical protein
MRECKNANIDLETLSEKNEDQKIESFQFPKRKLIVGQWVDVKDTIDQWLEAQVIDIKENKVYIHYNGWGTRWDEWIEMDSDRIMPFRYYTKQTTFSNYNCPFPNVKPDANVNVYNQNQNQNEANQPQQHQFYDLFSELSSSFDYCKSIFEQINYNREFIRKNKRKADTDKSFFDNFRIEIENGKNGANRRSVNCDNNIDADFDRANVAEQQENSSRNNINNANSNLIVIPDIREESKAFENNLVGNSTTENVDVDKLNRIKQREIFICSKQLSPLLDRLGRVMTDMGIYMFHNMKNNKLEE